MIKVGIVGGTGYTGVELLRLLVQHRQVELRAITSRVRVPVIASGGAAGPGDFIAAVRDGGADAVLAASIFHRRIHSIAEVKAAMAAAGLPVRAASLAA